MGKANLLTLLIVIGLACGILLGQYVLYDPAEPLTDAHWTKQAGTFLLLRPLLMLIVPLVFVSVVVGITSIGDPSKLGVVGAATFFYFAICVLIAVVLALALVLTIKPGVMPAEDSERLRAAAESEFHSNPMSQAIVRAEAADQTDLGGAWLNIIKQFIPTNIVRDMAEMNMLGIIVFGILLGLALALGGEITKPAVRFFDAMNEAMIILVGWVIWLAPAGVFLLVAWTVGSVGLDKLVGPMARYMATVLIGIAIHMFLILPLILAVFGRCNPYKYMWRTRQALLTAFGTSSSNATLPVTLKAAEVEGGCSKRATGFVVPIGATVNMDGTAIYIAVAVVFLCQIFGIQLDFTHILVIFITAPLAAVGAAGIPSAGLVTMVIVIHAVNTSISGDESSPLPIAAMGIIMGVDRVLDMCRTVINVWGDLVGAKIVTRLAPDPLPAAS